MEYQVFFQNGALIFITAPDQVNEVVVKPDTSTITATTKVWGRLNDLNCSVLLTKVTKLVLVTTPADKVTIDSRLTMPKETFSHEEYFRQHVQFPTCDLKTWYNNAPTTMRVRLDRISMVVGTKFTPPSASTPVNGTAISIINNGTYNVNADPATVMNILDKMGWGNLPYTQVIG